MTTFESKQNNTFNVFNSTKNIIKYDYKQICNILIKLQFPIKLNELKTINDVSKEILMSIFGFILYLCHNELIFDTQMEFNLAFTYLKGYIYNIYCIYIYFLFWLKIYMYVKKI